MATIQQLLDLFSRHGGKAFSLRDLQAEFDLNASERKALSRQLRVLEEDGVLARVKGGRYALAKRGRTVSGRLAVHRAGYGFVTPEGDKEGADLFVPARNLGPAMHGDRVLVEIERRRYAKQEGRILRVLERAHKSIIGRLEVSRGMTRLVPVDPQLHGSFLVRPGGEQGAHPGDAVIARIESYPGDGMPATALVSEVLGAADDPVVEIRIAAERFGLPYAFPDEVLAAAETVPRKVVNADLAGRQDLRSLPFVTIDGETARDFDDAVMIAEIPGQGYCLHVAIADVAHYVTANAVIDREAYKRGTSVYFPGSCLPMLPESLSNGICSLNPGVDRLVMVAEIEFDQRGHCRHTRFYPAVICSRARLTYTEVAQILVDRDPVARAEREELVPLLEAMGTLAGLRMALRHDRGSLDFDLPEAEIVLGLRGRPEQIIRAERNLAHRLIEEFMLAANEAVAEWLDQQRVPLIFRIHEPPSEEKMAAFQDFIAHFNQGMAIPVEGIQPKILQDLLQRVAGTPEEKLVNHVLLRSLPQARYASDNRGHFGLAATCYCHFTSPIRRYPDLIIHRLLRNRLGLANTGHGHLPASLEDIALQASMCERRAMEAERDIVNLKKCQYMAERIGESHAGFVVSVQHFGFFVELSDIFVEGLVHVATLNDDYYQFDDATHSLVGTGRRRRFTIGDAVVVQVQRVDTERREIDFSLVDDIPASVQRPQWRNLPRRRRS